MILLDVDVLVYAHREDPQNHKVCLNWLEDLINSDQVYGTSELVLSGVVRILTHPKIFNPPSQLADALSFVNTIRAQPCASSLRRGHANGISFVNCVGRRGRREIWFRTSNFRSNPVNLVHI